MVTAKTTRDVSAEPRDKSGKWTSANARKIAKKLYPDVDPLKGDIKEYARNTYARATFVGSYPTIGPKNKRRPGKYYIAAMQDGKGNIEHTTVHEDNLVSFLSQTADFGVDDVRAVYDDDGNIKTVEGIFGKAKAKKLFTPPAAPIYNTQGRLVDRPVRKKRIQKSHDVSRQPRGADGRWIDDFNRPKNVAYLERDGTIEAAKKHNLSVSEYQEAVNAKLNEIVHKGDVWIRREPTAIARILKDGRFKSVFEVGHKRYGMSGTREEYQKTREGAEKDIWGYEADTPVESRPIYAILTSNPFRRRTGKNFSVDDMEQYGSAAIRLKDHVRGRSTVTFDDSLDWLSTKLLRFGDDGSRIIYGVPDPLDKPSYRSAMLRARVDPLDKNTPEEFFPYTEVQIHPESLGEATLTVDDIAEVAFQKEPDPRLGKALTKRGIPWRVWETEPTDTFKSHDVSAEPRDAKGEWTTTGKKPSKDAMAGKRGIDPKARYFIYLNLHMGTKKPLVNKKTGQPIVNPKTGKKIMVPDQKVWSLKNIKTKLVDAHTDTVYLKNVQMHIGPSGRRRVINTGQKNVHAGIIGKVVDTTLETPPVDGWIDMHYNPKDHPEMAHGFFVIADAKNPDQRISHAQWARFTPQGTQIIGPSYIKGPHDDDLYTGGGVLGKDVTKSETTPTRKKSSHFTFPDTPRGPGRVGRDSNGSDKWFWGEEILKTA